MTKNESRPDPPGNGRDRLVVPSPRCSAGVSAAYGVTSASRGWTGDFPLKSSVCNGRQATGTSRAGRWVVDGSYRLPSTAHNPFHTRDPQTVAPLRAVWSPLGTGGEADKEVVKVVTSKKDSRLDLLVTASRRDRPGLVESRLVFRQVSAASTADVVGRAERASAEGPSTRAAARGGKSYGGIGSVSGNKSPVRGPSAPSTGDLRPPQTRSRRKEVLPCVR